MSKITLGDVTNLQTSSAAITINNNSDTIETAFDNTLSRDGTAPNQMQSDLDMNSNKIINLPDAINLTEPATLGQLEQAAGSGLTITVQTETLNVFDIGTKTSGTVTIDRTNGTKQKLTVGGNIIIAYTGWGATGKYSELELQLVNGGAFTVTWPATIRWLTGDGTSSNTFANMLVTLQGANSNWILTWTEDGGTTVWGKAI